MIDYDLLKSLPLDQGKEYLRQALASGVDPIRPPEMVVGGEGSGSTGIFSPDGYQAAFMPAQAEGPIPTEVAYYTPYEGYEAPGGGNYMPQYNPDGSLRDVYYQAPNTWVEDYGILLPFAAAAAAAYLPQALASAAPGSGGISPGVMAGLETAVPTAGAGGISPGVMAGLEAGLPSAGGISPGVMAGLEAGLPSAGGISPGVMAGLETAVPTAGTASSGLGALIPDALKSIGLKEALQLGIAGAGLVDTLTNKKSSGSGDAGYMNLVTPYTMDRQVNPQAKPLTSQDAYAYLRGQPSPTTGQPVSTAQQKWFNDTLTRQQTFDPVSGQRYVQGATGDLTTEEAVAEAQRKLDALRTGTRTAASGGIMALAQGGMAEGHLGGYSDGGRLLKGPGDGVSDSIPASIEGKQPARLADGEFVVPARIVSELGNGSTEAGARKLYAMMDRIQSARRNTTGKNAVAKDSQAEKYLPA